MAKHLQFLRNATISTNRSTAKTALLAKLATLLDGEVVINRYQDGDSVKVLLGFNNTVGADGSTKQFIFDSDAIPADVQTALDAITGEEGSIAKLKEAIVGKNTDDKDAETVYGAKAYAKDYADTLVNGLDAADNISVGSFVTKVSEENGKISVSKAAIASSDKTVTIKANETTGALDLAANIDGDTIIKSADGVLSVASSALTQYVGSDAVKVSAADTDNNKTISLAINTNDKVLSQDTNGLLTTLTISFDSTSRKVQLKGKDSTLVSEFDATAFVKDGILNDAKAFLATGTSQEVTFAGGSHTFTGLTTGNHYIGFEFATKGGEKTEYTYDILDATNIIDVYVAGNGLALSDHTFSVKKAADSETFLSVDGNGVKVSGVQNAIDTAAAKATTVVEKATSDAHINVTSTTAADGHKVYTVASVDTASASGLTTEITRAKAAEDKIEASVGLAADGSHVKTSGNYTSTATTIAGEIAALDTQVKTNTDAIGILNGANTVAGSVAKSIKDAVEALDVATVGGTGKVITTVSETDGKISATAIDLKAANVAATATEATDDKVAVEGTTVEAQIGSLAESVKATQKAAATYAVKKVETGLAANVKEAYQLVQTVDGQSTDIAVQIPVYKDSALKNVELTDEDGEGKKGQFLKFTYITEEGTEKIVYLDCSKFLVESEFKNGLTVNEAGEVSVLIDTVSEAFLSVDGNGVKLAGIQNAIDTAAAKATTVVEKATSDAHINVTSATAADGHKVYTVASVDTASASGLDSEITRAKAAEDKIEASVGLAADGSHVKTSGNYTSTATTIAGEIAALDTQVKTNADAIDVLNGTDTEDGSVAKSIKDAVEALDVAEVGGTGKVITTVSEADGKISATAIDLKAANVAATATEATDDKVAVEGTTVEAQIGSLAESIKTETDRATAAEAVIDAYVGKADIPEGKTVMGVIVENEETTANSIKSLATTSGLLGSDDEIAYTAPTTSGEFSTTTSIMDMLNHIDSVWNTIDCGSY